MLLNLSDEQLDASVNAELKSLLDTDPPVGVMRTGLHEILDKCAHGALASTFVMQVLDLAWQHYGGKHSDPAPWRTDDRRT